jgi:hypothetical protein
MVLEDSVRIVSQWHEKKLFEYFTLNSKERPSTKGHHLSKSMLTQDNFDSNKMDVSDRGY